MSEEKTPLEKWMEEEEYYFKYILPQELSEDRDMMDQISYWKEIEQAKAYHQQFDE